jgi:hypothetical protein
MIIDNYLMIGYGFCGVLGVGWSKVFMYRLIIEHDNECTVKNKGIEA